MSTASFTKQWLGKRVDYDGVFAYQCVDLIKQYLRQEHGIKAGAWGNAKDYWLKTNPALLKKFAKVKGKGKAGDIVILKPTATNKYGHIAIAINDKQMLEQNGSTGSGSGKGKDAIRIRQIPYDRVYGFLRPKTVKPTLKPIYYIVKKGDYLARIAVRFGTTVAKLVKLNKLKNPNLIRIGQRLRRK